MSTEPTPDQRAATIGVFKNIVNLLEHGMFFGHGAGYVVEAIGFLKANVAAMEGAQPAQPLHAVEEPKS